MTSLRRMRLRRVRRISGVRLRASPRHALVHGCCLTSRLLAVFAGNCRRGVVESGASAVRGVASPDTREAAVYK